MKVYLSCFIFFSLCIQNAVSQPRFGFEILSSRLRTENSGHLIGGGGCCTYYAIDKEEDPTTNSFTVGAFYKIHKHHLIKLRLGRHHNGRILDIRTHDDAGESNTFAGLNRPYEYFMLAPSYTYRLLDKKIVIPIELGFQINERLHEHRIFFVGIDRYNLDLSISAGLQYRITEHFIVGLHGK